MLPPKRRREAIILRVCDESTKGKPAALLHAIIHEKAQVVGWGGG